MKKRLFVAGIALVAMSAFVTGCDKTDDDATTTGTAKVRMHLTDGPADYDAIYLDIKSVEVTMAGSSAQTLSIIHPGTYNLLDFKNGLDTLLLEADLPAGTISQMRLILGDNNTIVVDGQTYPLSTPSAQQSGVKLNLNQNFVAGGAYDVWIDFDAAKSIVETGNGQYKLKPVIRAYSALTDGRIEGYVLPLAAFSTVYAVNGTDTFSAIPNLVSGYYKMSGLPSGNYSVWIDANAGGYLDTMISNVTVTYGMETDLGIITLHQ